MNPNARADLITIILALLLAACVICAIVAVTYQQGLLYW